MRKLGKHREGFEGLGEIANAVANPPPGNKKELDDDGGHNMKGRHVEYRASGVAVNLTRVIDDVVVYQDRERERRRICAIDISCWRLVNDRFDAIELFKYRAGHLTLTLKNKRGIFWGREATWKHPNGCDILGKEYGQIAGGSIP